MVLHGRFPELEAELLGIVHGRDYQGPGGSPDRADAMVWGLTAYTLGVEKAEPVFGDCDGGQCDGGQLVRMGCQPWYWRRLMWAYELMLGVQREFIIHRLSAAALDYGRC